MNQQTQPSPREHHFYVAIAKFLFHHPDHGVVSVQDPIKVKEAEQYGLSPGLQPVAAEEARRKRPGSYRVLPGPLPGRSK